MFLFQMIVIDQLQSRKASFITSHVISLSLSVSLSVCLSLSLSFSLSLSVPLFVSLSLSLSLSRSLSLSLLCLSLSIYLPGLLSLVLCLFCSSSPLPPRPLFFSSQFLCFYTYDFFVYIITFVPYFYFVFYFFRK